MKENAWKKIAARKETRRDREIDEEKVFARHARFRRVLVEITFWRTRGSRRRALEADLTGFDWN